MSDPTPETPPDTTTPEDSPTKGSSGRAPVDNSGGIEANEVNPDLPLIDPTGD